MTSTKRHPSKVDREVFRGEPIPPTAFYAGIVPLARKGDPEFRPYCRIITEPGPNAPESKRRAYAKARAKHEIDPDYWWDIVESMDRPVYLRLDGTYSVGMPRGTRRLTNRQAIAMSREMGGHHPDDEDPTAFGA